MSSVPVYLRSTQPESIDPDEDWVQQAELSPASHFNPSSKENRYVPAIPMEFIRQTLRVGDALPLLLVALARMRMRATSEISIGPTLWADVGNPSKRVRARLLRQLADLPQSLCIVVARPGRPHLLKAGPDWPAPARTKANHCRSKYI